MFTRGEDKTSIDPAAVAILARANAICAKATFCSTRAEQTGATCDICRRQAEAELRRERELREATRRRGRLLPRDRIR